MDDLLLTQIKLLAEKVAGLEASLKVHPSVNFNQGQNPRGSFNMPILFSGRS